MAARPTYISKLIAKLWQQGFLPYKTNYSSFVSVGKPLLRSYSALSTSKRRAKSHAKLSVAFLLKTPQQLKSELDILSNLRTCWKITPKTGYLNVSSWPNVLCIFLLTLVLSRSGVTPFAKAPIVVATRLSHALLLKRARSYQDMHAFRARSSLTAST